jgi:4-amino-4-deoxy-L-arabinose transferase-like glycosyltransferase
MNSETHPTTFRAWLRKHYEVILVGAILLAALALRLYNLEASSFWIDELTQIRRSRLSFFAMLKDVVREVSAVPIEYAVTHFVYYYIGRSEGILRLPAVLWGVSSVAAVYYLGRRMFDRTTGLLAAALLAFMPIQVYYSQEMRPYILASMMVLLTTLAFHRALTLNTRGAWALYGGTLVVGMYAHYYVAVVGILHGVYLVWMALAKRLPWRSLRPYLVAAGIAGLLFAPWVAADIYDMIVRKGVFLNEGRNFQLPALAALLRSPFVAQGANYALTADRPLTWFIAAAWALAAAGVALAFARKRDWWSRLGLAAVVGFGGMAAVLALDSTAAYYFATRQMVPFGPPIVLLVCAAWVGLFRAAWSRLARRPANWATGALAAILLLAFSVGTLAGPLSGVYAYRKHDWRGASRYLLQNVQRDDIVVTRIPYYPEIYVPELADQIIALTNAGTITSQAKTHARVWILERPDAMRNSMPDVQAWVDSEKPLEIKGFTGLRLYIYSESLTPQELKDSVRR